MLVKLSIECIIASYFQLLLCSADFVDRYLSTVLSEELRSMYLAIELLSLHEHLWELSNTSTSLSLGEIDDLLFAVLCY